MAHQAHNIPWSLLTSNLGWHLSNKCKDNATDLHWGRKPDRGKKINHFVKAFVANIHEHASCERKKFPESFDPLSPDDIILSDAICHKIVPAVYQWRTEERDWKYSCDESIRIICPHESTGEFLDESCKCPLPQSERRARAFWRPRRENSCYEFLDADKNRSAFFNLEIFKTLLMHGEMEVLLRIYSQPGHMLKDWWEARPCYDVDPDLGWDHICKHALKAYLLLNTIQCFTDTWQEGHGKQQSYQNMRSYQALVREITQTGRYSPVVKLPHRRFFGIADDQFGAFRWKQEKTIKKFFGGKYPLGRIPYQAFLDFEHNVGYVPHINDVLKVRQALYYNKKLPWEVVDHIVAMAGYGETMRRLPVEHDPFHPDNRTELIKYLTYCWQLLVRCEVMATVVGMKLDWEQLINKALVEIFKCDCTRGKVWRREITDDWDDLVLFI